jgi:hypothetical protein
MITIQPIQFTDNSNKATQLQVTSVNDDLSTSCIFNWVLYDTAGACVDNGTVSCTGVDYTNWSGDNMYPYQFVAGKLNLVINS